MKTILLGMGTTLGLFLLGFTILRLMIVPFFKQVVYTLLDAGIFLVVFFFVGKLTEVIL